MKNLITFCLLISCVISSFSQIIQLDKVVNRMQLPDEIQKWVNHTENDKKVVFLQILDIDLSELNWNSESLSIQLMGDTRSAHRIRTDRRNDHDQSWLGLLDDETTIFFTVQKNKIASKFYFDDMPMTLLPIGKKYHALIGYDLNKWPVTCGNNIDESRPESKPIPSNTSRTFSTDDICNMRVLAVITSEAESELPPDMSPAMLMQIGVDESNVAYAQSAVNLNMELAGVIRTSYQEVDLQNNSDCNPIDLEKFKNGDFPFDTAHTAREFFRADVMVLIRRDDWVIPATTDCSSFSIFGIAYHVATYEDQLSEDRAYAVMTWDGITVGRFTAAHEIGHLQGARHENHTASPSSAKGYISGNNTNDYRTIMTRSAAGGGCNSTQGCRIQYFSNPNILWNGNPTGTSSRNNASRINETADTIRGHRTTPVSSLLSNTNVASGLIANHIAKNTISTGGTIIAQNESKMTIRASQYVRLNPGFHALQGSTVACKAQIDACGELPPDVFDPMQTTPHPDESKAVKKRK